MPAAPAKVLCSYLIIIIIIILTMTGLGIGAPSHCARNTGLWHKELNWCLPLHHGLTQQVGRARRVAAVGISHFGGSQVGGQTAVADVEVGESGNGRLRFGR